MTTPTTSDASADSWGSASIAVTLPVVNDGRSWRDYLEPLLKAGIAASIDLNPSFLVDARRMELTPENYWELTRRIADKDDETEYMRSRRQGREPRPRAQGPVSAKNRNPFTRGSWYQNSPLRSTLMPSYQDADTPPSTRRILVVNADRLLGQPGYDVPEPANPELVKLNVWLRSRAVQARRELDSLGIHLYGIEVRTHETDHPPLQQVDAHWDFVTCHFVLSGEALADPSDVIGMIRRPLDQHDELEALSPHARFLDSIMKLCGYYDYSLTNGGFVGWMNWQKWVEKLQPKVRRCEGPVIDGDALMSVQTSSRRSPAPRFDRLMANFLASQVLTTAVLVASDEFPELPRMYSGYTQLAIEETWGLACAEGSRSGRQFPYAADSREFADAHSIQLGIARVWAQPDGISYVIGPSRGELQEAVGSRTISYDDQINQVVQAAHTRLLDFVILARRQSVYLEAQAAACAKAAVTYASQTRHGEPAHPGQLARKYRQLETSLNFFLGTLWFTRYVRHPEATEVLQLCQRVLELPERLGDIEQEQRQISRQLEAEQRQVKVQQAEERERNEEGKKQTREFFEFIASLVLPVTVVYSITGGLLLWPDKGLVWWNWAIPLLVSVAVTAVMLWAVVRRRNRAERAWADQIEEERARDHLYGSGSDTDYSARNQQNQQSGDRPESDDRLP